MNIIDVKDLDICYKNGNNSIYALKNINFSVRQGEYICVIGNNGSGKSTLIKSILGLIEPSRGIINVNLKKDQISYLAQIGTIPSEFPATVFEIVISGTQNPFEKISFYKKNNYELANEAIEKVGISNISSRLFFELSGGQQQRVLLARAICKKPRLLILDEPCNGLDHNISTAFYSLLQKLNKESGTTIFMVSHDIKKAKLYADRILELNKNIVFWGSKENWERVTSSGGKNGVN